MYVLKSKGECLEKIKEFKVFLEMQLKHTIKTSQPDNGGEFVSKAINFVLKGQDSEKQSSTPCTPQQNRVTYCTNHTIVDMAKNMFHEHSKPP